MQQGVVNWNRGSLELENGSKIMAASTSASAVRGMSFNIIFLDEFAFIPTHIADEFFSSVYPTISSGKSTKVIIISTPKGMNMFYKLWHDAEKGKNEYTTTEVHWSQVPGRDAEWKEQTIKNTSEEQFNQEFECEFLGSVNTLITSSKLKVLPYDDPIKKSAGLDIFEDPIEGHDYVCTVDVARGITKDYSAFVIVDTTEIPYKLVAKYRNNKIKPLLFPNIIAQVCTQYNHAYTLIEVNDIGGQVADIMQFDLVSPERRLASLEVTAVQIPGADGDLTAMPGHAPVITNLRPGILKVEAPSGNTDYVVTGGFAEIGEGLSVLAERALPLDELSQDAFDEILEEAKSMYKKVEEEFQNQPGPVDDAAKLLSDMVAMGEQIGLNSNK